MTETHENLLHQAVAGDAEALTALLEAYGGEVRAQLRIEPKWASAIDADDVMQVTYLEAFLRIGRFEPQGIPAFLGWLRRIAENNLRDAVKELERVKRPPRDRRVMATGDESAAGLLEQLGATRTTPSRVASGREASSLLQDALTGLPPDYAAVIRMYDLEGRPIEDVARVLRRTPGAVHMLRVRAHDHLRERLGAESQFFTRGA